MNEMIINGLYPDYKVKLLQRYNILKQIGLNNNIGRRKLSNLLNLNERFVRNETEKLFEIGLITIEQMGMNITKEGLNMIELAKDYITVLKGNESLEKDIQNLLGIKKVIVSSGSIFEADGKRELFKTASSFLLDSIKDKITLGITGGSTIGQTIDSIKTNKSYTDLIVVPVRGSLKGTITNQANILAIKLAEKLNSKYSNFYLPDNFDLNNLKDLSKVPEVKDTLELIDNLDLLLFGIGDAVKMANRRLLPEDEIDRLKESGAVAEAFGNYFDLDGNIVLKSKSIGISFKQFENVKNVIAVAGDDDKEKAIIAISSVRKDLTLIITEECAKNIKEYFNN